MAKIRWHDTLSLNGIVAGVVGLLFWRRRRKDPAATSPGQRLSKEGIVLCTNCSPKHHPALFHLERGCIFCPCLRTEHDFVYPKPVPLSLRKKVTP